MSAHDGHGMHPNEAMKMTIVGFGLALLSVGFVALGGAYFRQLGSTTIFATLSLCSSLAYAVTYGSRPILGRVTLLLWAIASLRILGFESTPATFRVSYFMAIWFALLLILLTTLHLCLLPVGMGALQSIRRPFAVRGSLEASRNRDLWYFRRIVSAPLSPFLQVLLVSCAAWGWERQHTIQTGLLVDPVSAISLGLLWPTTVLTAKVFALRPIGDEGSRKVGLVFEGVKVKTAAFAATAAVVYVYGLVLEFRSTRLLWLWSLCFTYCLIAALCLGRTGGILSQGADVIPQQVMHGAQGAKQNLMLMILVALASLAFGLLYLWLLLLTFRPSFFAGID